MTRPTLLALLLLALITTPATAQRDCIEMEWQPPATPEGMTHDYNVIYAINGRGVIKSYWGGDHYDGGPEPFGELCFPDDDPGPWFVWASAWFLHWGPFRHELQHSEFRLLRRGNEVGPLRLEFAPLE